MKKTALGFFTAILMIAFSTQLGFAQGSPYNLIGFGTTLPSSNPVIDGRAGAGVAMGATSTLNTENPADWSWMDRARFEIALRYEYFSFQQSGDQGIEHNVHFNGFTFGAPVWSKYNATVGLGYVGLTNAGAEVDRSDSSGSTSYSSIGGANMGFIGVGARPVKALALGARLGVILGNIRHLDVLSFTDPTIASSNFERDYYFNGVRPTFGAQFIGDSGGVAGLTIGASYSLATNLKSTRETIITPLLSTLDTTLPVGGTGRYPSSLRAGIAYRLSPRFQVEADYAMENFAGSYVFSDAGAITDSSLRNSSRIAFAIERKDNAYDEYGTSYGLDRWALRLGLYYDQTPLNPAGSGGINEIGVSAGVGIPFSYQSLLNLSLAVGQRQPANTGLAPKELFMRLGASIGLSERWFVPLRRED